MKLLDLGDRVIAYFTEQSFLVALSIIIDFAFMKKSYISGFFVLYQIDFITGIRNIFTTQYGLIDLAILSIVSFIYYTFESLTNFGIASLIFHKRIITKYSIRPALKVRLILVRNAIKSFFLIEFFNFIFVLIYRKYMQTAYDRTTNLIVSEINENDHKSPAHQLVYSSIIVYYSIFGLLLLLYLYISPIAALPRGTGSSSYHFYTFFKSILTNNMELDLFKYVLSGFTLFIGTFINLYSSTILETVVMAGLIRGSTANSAMRYILPQFFPETLGYIFGIAVAMVITHFILSFFQSALRRERFSYFLSKSNNYGIMAITFLAMSVSLLIIGALIEASIG